MKILTISQVMNGFRIVEHVEDISEPTREWVYPTKAGMQEFVDGFFGHALNPAEDRGPAVAGESGKGLSALSPATLKAIGENIMSRNSLDATQALQEPEAEAMGGYGGVSPTNAWTEEAQAVRSQVDAANLESEPKGISEITASLIKRQGL